MANPTTNYGFVLPTPTDLVTDLPADFDIALQGVDTRLKALQPGTTAGDLAYSSATANTNVRLGIGTAGQVLAVSGGVPAWTTTADVTPLTTKGDLFTFTTVDARLAVGNSGETLVANSSSASGLSYTAGNPIPNPVLNSSYEIWQRGTSVSVPASTLTYTADRWQAFNNANQALTVSRQATNDSSLLPFVQYCARVQRNSGQTGTSYYGVSQSFESANSVPFAGKIVTISFYARAGANYSPTSSLLRFFGMTGTGTDQNGNGSYTGAVGFLDSDATLTTSWNRFSFTTSALATNTNEIYISLKANATGTASTNDYFEVTGVQIDIGSVALPVRRNGATIQGETSACQRYYWRTLAGGNQSVAFGGNIPTTNIAVFNTQYPVLMRSNPTLSSGTAASLTVAYGANQSVVGNTITGDVVGQTLGQWYITVAGTPFTIGGAARCFSSATSGYVEFSAEL